MHMHVCACLNPRCFIIDGLTEARAHSTAASMEEGHIHRQGKA